MHRFPAVPCARGRLPAPAPSRRRRRRRHRQPSASLTAARRPRRTTRPSRAGCSGRTGCRGAATAGAGAAMRAAGAAGSAGDDGRDAGSPGAATRMEDRGNDRRLLERRRRRRPPPSLAARRHGGSRPRAGAARSALLVRGACLCCGAVCSGPPLLARAYSCSAVGAFSAPPPAPGPVPLRRRAVHGPCFPYSDRASRAWAGPPVRALSPSLLVPLRVRPRPSGPERSRASRSAGEMPPGRGADRRSRRHPAARLRALLRPRLEGPAVATSPAAGLTAPSRAPRIRWAGFRGGPCRIRAPFRAPPPRAPRRPACRSAALSLSSS